MNEPRGRPFAPGNTLGRGRPTGSRNKANSPAQDLLDKYTPHLVSKCIDLAMKGDRSAMRVCMERISPARRDAPIRMSLPSIRTVQDVDKAADKVTQAIRRGAITPSDGEKLMNIFEIRGRIIEKGDFESRVEKLEKDMAAAAEERLRAA
jgi:hypothetical protein